MARDWLVPPLRLQFSDLGNSSVGMLWCTAGLSCQLPSGDQILQSHCPETQSKTISNWMKTRRFEKEHHLKSFPSVPLNHLANETVVIHFRYGGCCLSNAPGPNIFSSVSKLLSLLILSIYNQLTNNWLLLIIPAGCQIPNLFVQVDVD